MLIIGVSLSFVAVFYIQNHQKQNITAEFEHIVEKRAQALQQNLNWKAQTLRNLADFVSVIKDNDVDFIKNTIKQFNFNQQDLLSLTWLSHDQLVSEHLNEEISNALKLKQNIQQFGPQFKVQLEQPSLLQKNIFTQEFMVINGKVTMPSEQQPKPYFVVIVPITDVNDQAHPLDTQTRNVFGYFVALYDLKNTFEQSALMGDSMGINMRLVDITNTEKTVLLSHLSRKKDLSVSDLKYHTNNLVFGDKRLQLEAQATDRFIKERLSFLPFIVIPLGMFISSYFARFIKRKFYPSNFDN